MSQKVFYTTYRLAHLQPVGATFFITIRLKGSIPISKLAELQLNQSEMIGWLEKLRPDGYKKEIRRIKKQFFAKYDTLLDKVYAGPTHLNIPEVAQIVIESLNVYDGKYYELLAYCIMPNHVHLLIDTSIQIKDLNPDVDSAYIPLRKIMKYIKGGSARKANLYLGKKGTPFWQRDYFDYYVRNQEELLRIVTYILENPVKARLVENWDDWPYSFYKAGEF